MPIRRHLRKPGKNYSKVYKKEQLESIHGHIHKPRNSAEKKQ